MITVINAGSLSGYSQTDHLIEDSAIREIIGKEFRSVKQALKAADDRCFLEKFLGRRIRHPYTWIEVRFANGEVREFKSV